MHRKLRVLVDSREQSVSCARDFYVKSHLQLGIVRHFRVKDFAKTLYEEARSLAKDELLLVSAHYISINQLKDAERYLTAAMAKQIAVASYDCFEHIASWSSKMGCRFLPNPFKRRKYESLSDRKRFLRDRDSGVRDIDRLWIQYRLMISIISRVYSLDEVCHQLVCGEARLGETLENEYMRALRYFQMGEPDMAGGTYYNEESRSKNLIDGIREKINKVAATDFNVLIKGESGSGKEVVAWAIHELSLRKNKPYITINCAGIPDELLESELFGYSKGSHNLAYEDSIGLLGSAAGGTLFLDELPDMSPRIQSKMLRFLEIGEYRPIGGTENKYADVRIIAAGQPARFETRGSVRVDLINRIGQLDVSIPPLREVESKNPGTIAKIAYILIERMTWTNVYHDGELTELNPNDIKTYQEHISKPENTSIISDFPWEESNGRELNNFLRKWIVFGNEAFHNLSISSRSTGESTNRYIDCYDDDLRSLLTIPQSREDLKKLFAKKPFHNIKRSYVRHIYEVYSKIIENECTSTGYSIKPTQKELAKLMGVTENTICRYLN